MWEVITWIIVAIVVIMTACLCACNADSITKKLEKKGYIVRTRSSVDRRVVHLSLSKKGRLVYRLHRRFHKSMVMRITEGFNDEELKVMSKGLENLHAFLEELK